MTLLGKLFKKNPVKAQKEIDWENVVYNRDSVDFNDEEQRTRYVTGCLEQIAEASKEVNILASEYSIVTSQLMDMEEIEQLPEPERQKINSIAHSLVTMEQECRKYRGKKDRMKDSDYLQMRKQESEVVEGIKKLKEAEGYGELVKKDLQRIDRERQAYDYRRAELLTMMNNFRGMTVIFLTAFILCIVLLLVLQFVFEMETRIGILLAVGAVSIAVTVAIVKYMDSEKELKRVEKASNKLIQLQNKVKIRYVNNRNLLEYLRIKYNAENAQVLEKRWKQYQKEKEERREYAEAEAKVERYQNLLLEQLNKFHISDPSRWIHQAAALLDKREMVEIRHELILRRQALRKQLDYNNNIADTARQEIIDIVNEYPLYGPEILAMLDKYDVEN